MYSPCRALRLARRKGDRARSIVYSSRFSPHTTPSTLDLFLYDVATKSVRRLTHDGDRLDEQSPRFLDADHVAFVTSAVDTSNPNRPVTTGVLGVVDLRSRRVCQLFGLLDDVRSLASSPDGRTIAFTHGESPERLALYSLVDRRAHDIRTLGEVGGRELAEVDSFSIQWSNDGSKLLVSDTGLTGSGTRRPSIFVVDREGHDVMAPRAGTFALWLDAGSILYSTYSYSSARSWFTVDLATGRRRSYGLPASAFRPQLSSDGALIAYDDAKGTTPSVFAYATASSHSRRLGSGVAPIWLDSRDFAATQTKRCTGGQCDFSAWEGLDRSTRFDLSAGSSSSIPLMTTFDVDVLYE